MRAVWSSVIRGPPKTPGFSAMFAGPKMRVMIRAAARRPHAVSRTIDVKRQRCSSIRPAIDGTRISARALFALQQQYRRTSHPVAVLAAAPKFLILEVIELYRVEPIFMAASCSQDVMRSARRVLARVGVPSREGWFLYVARRVRPPSSQLPLGFRLGSHSAKARSEAFGPAPLS
jgi:hypothetical protein